MVHIGSPFIGFILPCTIDGVAANLKCDKSQHGSVKRVRYPTETDNRFVLERLGASDWPLIILGQCACSTCELAHTFHEKFSVL